MILCFFRWWRWMVGKKMLLKQIYYFSIFSVLLHFELCAVCGIKLIKILKVLFTFVTLSQTKRILTHTPALHISVANIKPTFGDNTFFRIFTLLGFYFALFFFMFLVWNKNYFPPAWNGKKLLLVFVFTTQYSMSVWN